MRLPPRVDSTDLCQIGAKVVSSCAGLLIYAKLQYMSKIKETFICNPTTRTIKRLCFPSSLVDNDYDCWRKVSVNLAFDPTKSLDYKVIYVDWDPKINASDDQPCMSIGIETNSGRLSKLKFNWDNVAEMVNYNLGVFINGAIHWPSCGTETYYFDVENECLEKMPMPETNKGSIYFGECGGYLNLAVADCDAQFMCNVFEMSENRSYWYLKYSLNCDIPSDLLLDGVYFPSMFRFRPVCIQYDSREEGDSLFVEFRKGGMCYSFKDGTFKRKHPNVFWERWGPSTTSWCEAYQYIETLYPV